MSEGIRFRNVFFISNNYIMNYDFIKKGNKVFWHDPDCGLSDGLYEVISVPEEIEDDSIILIASDYSEAEVFPTKLSPL